MQRTELNDVIKNIYQDTLNEMDALSLSENMKRESSRIEQLQESLNKIINSVTFVNYEKINSIKIRQENLFEELKSEIQRTIQDTTYNDFENNCNNRANIYMDAVKEFTRSGNTGFYDVGYVLSVNHENNINKVKSILNKFIEEGKDLIVVNEVEGEVDDPIHIRGRVKRLDISVMIPSSIYDEFETLLESVIDKRPIYKDLDLIKKTQYFISPMINNIDDLTIERVRETIKYLNEKDDKHPYTNVLYGFASLGYARYEISDWSRESVLDKIKEMLLNISLYSKNKNEHINGIMPTIYCYSQEEIEDYNINTTGFIKNEKSERTLKNLNIVDDLKIYKALESKKNKSKNRMKA